MNDLNQFKANFPAKNHDLPAVVAREFDDAMKASPAKNVGQAHRNHQIVGALSRPFIAVMRSWFAARPSKSISS